RYRRPSAPGTRRSLPVNVGGHRRTAHSRIASLCTPGARVSFAMIDSPARVGALTASGDSFSTLAFCFGVADASICASAVTASQGSPGPLPVRAVISAASRVHDRPVLVGGPYAAVVLQAVRPGGALSPPKQYEPWSNPGANHLKPIGTFDGHRHPRARDCWTRPLLVSGNPISAEAPSRLAAEAAVDKTLVSSSMIDRV